MWSSVHGSTATSYFKGHWWRMGNFRSKLEITVHERTLWNWKRAELGWYCTEWLCAMCPAFALALPMSWYNAVKYFPCNKIPQIHEYGLRQNPPQKNLNRPEKWVFICLTGPPHASQSSHTFLKQEHQRLTQDSALTATPHLVFQIYPHSRQCLRGIKYFHFSIRLSLLHWLRRVTLLEERTGFNWMIVVIILQYMSSQGIILYTLNLQCCRSTVSKLKENQPTRQAQFYFNLIQGRPGFTRK